MAQVQEKTKKNNGVKKKYYPEPTAESRKIGTAESDRLILEYSPLIKYVAYRIAVRLPPHVEIDDLISAGVIGLIDAIEKFDPTKETQFKTYAEIRIRGAILDELRSQDWVPRSVRQKTTQIANAYAKLEQEFGRPAEDEEVAREMGLELEEYFELLKNSQGLPIMSFEDLGGHGEDPDRQNIMDVLTGTKDSDPQTLARISEIRKIMIDAIDRPPEKERLVISLYYYDELTMKEIGEVLEITESRVSQIHTKAVLRLRGKLRNFIHDLEDEV
jgi:RNA polymerase sigma factor for flagellar operon FliA